MLLMNAVRLCGTRVGSDNWKSYVGKGLSADFLIAKARLKYPRGQELRYTLKELAPF